MPRKPKSIKDIATYSRQFSDVAIRTLVGIAASPRANDSARVSAAIALLNRAWGSSPQTINVNQTVDKTAVREQLLELFGQVESTAKDITPTNESSKSLQ